MNLNNYQLIRLTDNYTIKPFDCGNTDLNEFLNNDAKNYQKELLTVTYILESDLETVAFFSLLNDKITFEIEANKNKSLWNRINRKVPNSKRSTKGYPAMKIVRLAVNINYKGNNIGTLILDYLKGLFIENNRTGCKFITLDAYKESLDFYSKNEFKFLTIEDELEETRLMYFNLSNLFD
jgi:hypothetical protein